MNHAVVIAGGGPTGMMLAAELALARVDVAIVERRATQKLDGPRSRGLNARSIEVLDQRGVAERFLAEGTTVQSASFAMVRLGLEDLPTRHPYVLALAQERFEHVLGAWLAELGVPVYRERCVTGFSQDTMGVDVELQDGSSMRAGYLVGCDGGRSVVRKQAGIDFPGWEPSTSYLIAECEMTSEPALGMRRDARGTHGMARLEDGRRIGLVTSELQVSRGDAPTLGELRAALVSVYGTDFGVHGVTWLSRFTDMARQAASYRAGRVLLAGDAAHVHSPVGGQGLNLGLQDAVNLGWKLAQVVHGASSDSLLDTYQAERHPIAARVLRLSLAQTALGRGDERSRAAHEAITELLGMDEPRRRYGAMMSGLDVHYGPGAGHPLLGRRMPDLDVLVEGCAHRVYGLLHDAKAVVLDFRGTLAVACGDGVKHVVARFEGAWWLLPGVGPIAAPHAVLIRPDGHVAWVGDGTARGLREALTTWCGVPAE